MDVSKIKRFLYLLQNEIKDNCFVHLQYDDRRDRHYDICSGCCAMVTYEELSCARKIEHHPDCTTQEIERLIDELMSELPKD